jgi:hypothetical protein
VISFANHQWGMKKTPTDGSLTLFVIPKRKCSVTNKVLKYSFGYSVIRSFFMFIYKYKIIRHINNRKGSVIVKMITPIFRIFDIEKANIFYLNYLGFRLDWTHQYDKNMPIYCQVSLNEAVLHLSEHHGDSSPGSAIRIKISNLKNYHSSLIESEYTYSKPSIEKTPWNTIELTVIDPFSNRIIFYEDIK